MRRRLALPRVGEEASSLLIDEWPVWDTGDNHLAAVERSVMSEGESRIRTILTSYFPMFIATLSLCAAIFNGYLNNQFIKLIRHNVERVEYMKTCKEVIDAYFQIKFRTRQLNAHAADTNAMTPRDLRLEQAETSNAVMKFAALGTYLANLRDEATRARYTDLVDLLTKITDNAQRTPVTELGRQFEPADRIFTEMNDDCVKRATQAPA